jgi:hypothetical protein
VHKREKKDSNAQTSLISYFFFVDVCYKSVRSFFYRNTSLPFSREGKKEGIPVSLVIICWFCLQKSM